MLPHLLHLTQTPVIWHKIPASNELNRPTTDAHPKSPMRNSTLVMGIEIIHWFGCYYVIIIIFALSWASSKLHLLPIKYEFRQKLRFLLDEKKKQ